MEKIKILFWKEPYNSDNSFVKDTNSFITSAYVTKTIKNQIEVFHIKLNDIGLDSLYGEFELTRNQGFWQTTDKDTADFNFLKWNIISALEYSKL